jgi:hypothetical protein
MKVEDCPLCKWACRAMIAIAGSGDTPEYREAWKFMELQVKDHHLGLHIDPAELQRRLDVQPSTMNPPPHDRHPAGTAAQRTEGNEMRRAIGLFDHDDDGRLYVYRWGPFYSLHTNQWEWALYPAKSTTEETSK